MNRIFRTPTQALLADIVCWVSLVALLGYLFINVANPVLSGAIIVITLGVALFALVYNGRNVRTVVRSALQRRRYEREEAERRARYEREEAERLRRDAAYGRELRDLNRRYDRY